MNDVLVKACANDPNRRYASAAEMYRDLAALDRGEPLPRKKWRWKIAALSILAVAISGVWFWLHLQSRSGGIDIHLHTMIRTEPADALVILGDHVQRTPATFNDLEPRKYKLEMKHPGYEPIETLVDLSRGQSLDLPKFLLVRSKGAIEIRSEPPGAQFSLRSEDGQTSREGLTPKSIVDLPAGGYSLVVRRGDWEMQDAVEIQRGQTAQKSFAFVKAAANITSEPAGAEILVDGASRGRTPLAIELPARSHELVAHLDGWPDQKQSFAVEAQRENSLISFSRTEA